MHDIAEFLGRHEPFDQLAEDALARLATRTEVEYFTEGTVIFEQNASPREHVRMIRRGAVELRDGPQVLDGLGEGEMFGHPSMLTGLPTEFEARAAEGTLCYRIAATDITPLLARPEAIRYLAREMRHRETLRGEGGAAVAARLAGRHVAAVVEPRCVVCAPETTIRDAAAQMVAAEVSCAVVRLPDGHGILTDRDLRERVVAAGRSGDDRVAAVMSAPAMCTDPGATVTEVALLMIERGVRHVPVVRADGEVLGVLGDRDLVAAETRTPFTLRREIDAARTPAEVQTLARRLPRVLVALHDADTSAPQISGVHAAIADAIIIRLLALADGAADRPRVRPAWIALGSHGRRELAPGSDLDSAVTWPDGAGADDERALRRVVRETVAALAPLAGVAPDAHGVTADSALFARSLAGWRETVRRWAADPTVEKVPLVLSALLDGRVVGPGPAWGELVLAEMTDPAARVELQRWLLRLALAHRVPTGLARSRALGPIGARGHVDLKRDGLLPIVDLARYVGFVAGAGVLSTPERLRAAAARGVLAADDAQMLVEAHELFSDLRMSHHIELLRAERPIADAVDPATFNALTRRYVRDAFGLVAGVQRRIAVDLPLA